MSRTPSLPRSGLDRVWPATWSRLTELEAWEQPLDPEFAQAASRVNSMVLSAARWHIGPEREPVAECRIVRIKGVTAEIVNTLVFPFRPDLVPVFVADLLLFGGKPRLAFVDLQGPGLCEPQRQSVADRTRRLAGRHGVLTQAPDPPEWAVCHSLGGFVYTRSASATAKQLLPQLYDDYLGGWMEAVPGVQPAAMPPVPQAEMALAAYKRLHATASPVPEFLAKSFGTTWADRFLHGFLYR